MELSLKDLIQNLREAKQEPTIQLPEVSPYLMSHIYEPLCRDEDILLKDIDFREFSLEDIDDLKYVLALKENAQWRQNMLCGIFRNSPPISRTSQSFC